MTYLIKDLPDSEKPRERLIKNGVRSLSNEELLSIILRCGTKNKSVKEVSLDILKKYNIHELSNINYKSLSNIKGVGDVKAVTLIAAIELGKRSINNKDKIKKINTSLDVYNLLKYELNNELQEKFIAIYLDNRKNIILVKTLFVGTVNSSNVYPRDVFREAVKCNCSGMILVHNHPAGSIEPSYQDICLTTTFIKIGKIMGINIIDHVIIGKDNYYSFLQKQGELFEKET